MSERKAFPLRLSPELYEELRRWADADLRSVNGQIEFLLRRSGGDGDVSGGSGGEASGPREDPAGSGES
jgi:hypothetical protein